MCIRRDFSKIAVHRQDSPETPAMTQARKLGIVMDPIESITPYKDSSLAMMLEAQSRGWQIYYFLLDDIFLDNSIAMGQFKTLTLFDDNQHWFDYGEAGRCRHQTSAGYHQTGSKF